MKPIIGIICRPGISDAGHNINIIYNSLIDAIRCSGGIPVGIDNSNIDDYIDICQGFILQGGDVSEENNYKIIKKMHELNIPILGICQGMQEMCEINCGKLIKVDNHSSNSFHSVNIKDDSLLYKIINMSHIDVNTRHKETIIDTKWDVVAKADDGIVEAIEDSSKIFFIGVQWHPETIYHKDINSKKIFDYFITVCDKNNKIV